MTSTTDTTTIEILPTEPTDTTETTAADASVAVRATQLSKRYGNLLAVNGLDLTVPRGSIFGLIGPNGAGKSTTFAMMSSLLLPTSGRIVVMGADPSRKPRTVRRRMGYMPDNLGVYDNLRVDEYLEFFAASYGIARTEWTDLVDGLLELVDLSVKRTAMVNSLSRGMKQRLSLARALVHDPELLVLDEPASGLDPRARVELRELLKTLNGMGKTIIISSHILSELEEMCTDVAIMEAGKLLAAGPPRQILERLGGARNVRVRFANGASEAFSVADDAEQSALLRRLVVEEGRDVVEFVEESGGLEQLFMSLTEGIVQ
ncbi:MAG: ABC transporter ATP-binding protein [Actinomycetia bacterium]|nr:ABC transporter ATP-binding protein [Actinomycetes bacterium]